MTDSVSSPGTWSTAPVNFVVTLAQMETLIQSLVNSTKVVNSDGSSSSSLQSSRPIAPTIPPFVRPLSSPVTDLKSVIDRFCTIPSKVILDVIKHEISPHHLYKLDYERSLTGLPGNVVDLGEGRVMLEEWDCTVKYYPTLYSLLDPLMVYFNIIGAHAATSESAHSVLEVLDACAAYTTHLLKFHLLYKWSAVLKYHRMFFQKRQREMARGDFSGWGTIDSNLLCSYLLPEGLPLSVEEQTCHKFNRGRCRRASACPAGRIHRCMQCSATDHGMNTCPHIQGSE